MATNLRSANPIALATAKLYAVFCIDGQHEFEELAGVEQIAKLTLGRFCDGPCYKLKLPRIFITVESNAQE